MDYSGYLYLSEFKVRDYECDLQGVVNNANYQHFLEHARHEFLVSKGISFQELHEQGLDLIVTNIEIDYKFPLKSRDSFIVTVNVERKGYIRIIFLQEIYRVPDNKLIIKAKVTTAAARNGKPVYPAELLKQLGLE